MIPLPLENCFHSNTKSHSDMGHGKCGIRAGVVKNKSNAAIFFN